MYLPDTPPLLTFDVAINDQETRRQGFSNLIGIITAICGNILISFALNTQRYAHLRLSRAEEGQRKGKTKPEGKLNTGTNRRTYGTQQESIAEDRARRNAESEPDANIDPHVAAGNEEQELLIPKVNDRKDTRSTSESYVGDEKDDASNGKKSYLKSPIWWLGISLMVVGEAGNFLAYGFAPASIVSPLGVVALVSNCLIAPLLLHEQFRIRDGVGVIIAIAGCVTVVLSANGSDPKLDPDDIWDLITRWEFETYLGITVFLIILLMVASNKFGHRTVLIDLGLVGLFGGYTALSTKGVASLLSNTIWRVVTFPITYLLLAILISTAILQIKYVNRALQRFNSTIVIPTQFVIFTISVIAGSAILYRDFERRSLEDAGKFFGGCALTFLGVWCITSGRSDGADEGDDAEEDADVVKLVDETTTQSKSGRQADLLPDQAPTSSSPALRRTSSAKEAPILLQPDVPSPFDKSWHLSPGPANRSAIHLSSTAEIRPPTSKPNKPPAMHATTSAPIVPTFNMTHSDSLRPHTPLQRLPSGPSTPEASRLSPHVSGSQRLLSRHSIVDLLPGPLTSPLSSSLSAIVADSLRRGVQHTPASIYSRRSPFRRITTGPDEDARNRRTAPNRRSIASGELDLDNETSDVRALESNHNGRSRSFSATISDIFGSAAKRRKPDDAGGTDSERV